MVTEEEKKVLTDLADIVSKTKQKLASMDPSNASYEKTVKCLGVVSKQYNDLLKTIAMKEKDEAQIKIDEAKLALDEQRAQNELLIENRKLDVETNKVQVSSISELKKTKYDIVKSGIIAGVRTALVGASIAGVNNGWLMKTNDLHLNDPLDKL